jgi:hypothetical protein
MHNEWPNGQIDHINGDRLDNRICNLRVASHAENQRNSRRPTANTSGIKGVSWDKRESKWQANIRVNNKMINLGRFNNKEDAAAVYRAAALRYHGDFAKFD